MMAIGGFDVVTKPGCLVNVGCRAREHESCALCCRETVATVTDGKDNKTA